MSLSEQIHQLLVTEQLEIHGRAEKVTGYYNALPWQLKQLQQDTGLSPERIIEAAERTARTMYDGSAWQPRQVIDLLHAFYQNAYLERTVAAAKEQKRREDQEKLDRINAELAKLGLGPASLKKE